VGIIATVTSALGGVIVFLSALVVTIRSIFKQIGTVEKNTAAVRELSSKIERISGTLINHEHRITVLEEKAK
jgi:hypothetical protein